MSYLWSKSVVSQGQITWYSLCNWGRKERKGEIEKAIITTQSSLSKGFHSSPITSNDSNLSHCTFTMWFIQKWQADVRELEKKKKASEGSCTSQNP